VKINWRNRRNTLIAIGAICAAVFVAGMIAAFVNRHHAICPDGKTPVAQRDGILGQTEYQCHDGRVVTTS